MIYNQHIIKPDWKKFKAKFSENLQGNFEWFCYLLFCKEFDKPAGIFRYKNQSGIETNPIKKDNEIIGWQSRFYETTLSTHKDDLIEAITKTKRDYPNVTKVIFYTNQEWGQGRSQNDPKAKIDVEQKANELKIVIEWKSAGFFESPFVTVDNKIISQHFFSLDSSVIDLLEEKKSHSEYILYEIGTEIIFDGKKIEINRSESLKELESEIRQKQVLIISGVSGVGKTAVVKKFYEKQDIIPFYIFKASEFQLNNINELFGNLSLDAFIEVHKDENYKIIVIDSAEKLLDLVNTDPFKEFLFNLIKTNWKIIFTTRNSYLEDLNFQFIDIYKITPFNLNIQNLNQEELENLSKSYSFILPTIKKLLELIKNPFYLNEYLKYYNKNEAIDYLDFKQKLWNKTTRKANPNREQCFLQVAFQRASEGRFFIYNTSLDPQILIQLVQDGILGYEKSGYFITHDIYEEWALEIIIDSEFINRTNNANFFNKIGQSISIRRSFRNWLSEKLFLKDDLIRRFIEDAMLDKEIDSFWKDEILVSVLLSDYAKTFFDLFAEKLVEDNHKLLKKITFLTRIACKEVDNDIFKQLGVKEIDLLSAKYIFTKPKGEGWKALINFLYENLEKINKENFYFFIIPIIHDWNSKFKEGETTRQSGLIALQIIQWIIKKDISFYRDKDIKEKLLQTILYGAHEIKDKLMGIIEEIILNKWKYHRDPYYDLSKTILTKLEGISIARVLPEHVLRLADLFWFYTPKEKDFYYHSRMGIEQYFCLEDNHSDYFPSSAYQTPVYWLLQSSLKKTVDFILAFTNKAMECFAKSDLGKKEIEEIRVFISESETLNQYICDRIWNIYRGTQVNPHVLSSMHMALEKYFLERGNIYDSRTLESWLLYLLKNSKSSSISAIVTSIVLAYPEKTFNVATVLFRTKEFFHFDLRRLVMDQSAKSLFSVGYGLNYKNNMYQDERIRTCDDKHRKISLEQLALNYQLFRTDQITEDDAKKRQQIIWAIFDKYYDGLKNQNKVVDDKDWRLSLARMDRRKMKPTTEVKDKDIILNLNPEIDSELKKYSEESQQKNDELMKYFPLRIWAENKIKNDKESEQYEQYEKRPELALEEVKEIIPKLEILKKRVYLKSPNPEDKNFYLFNHDIPSKVCSVLVTDYFDILSDKDKIICKDIIIETTSASLRANYQYQISDGVESAIYALPILLNAFPEEKSIIKTILLLTLFNSSSIGAYGQFSDFSVNSIKVNLWEKNFEDANSILLGYLSLKPKYEKIREKIRREKLNKNVYEVYENEVSEIFLKENETDVEKVIENKLSFNDVEDIAKLDLDILKTAFKIIPLKTALKEHKEIAEIIISTFAKELLSDIRDDKIDYEVKYEFLKQLSCFILNSSENDITNYLKPFIDNFNNSDAIAELFREFILAEDTLNTYDNFWFIWNLFYKKIINLCKDRDNCRHLENIIESYLFARTPWKETTKDWHTLKETDKLFFEKISSNIGYCSSTLFSISKLLNGIGEKFLNIGIFWISKMLKNNNIWGNELINDTIFYLEIIIRKYLYNNREKVKKTNELKQNILIILKFLIEKGSVVGYMLRENIL